MMLGLEKHKIVVFIFFALFLVLGLFLVKDYGISMDESEQRNMGLYAFNCIVKGNDFQHFESKDYGPLIRILLVVLEKGLHLTNNTRAVYLMRHAVIFLFFYLGVIFFYQLCNRFFRSWQTALLGCAFLILSPRIFADAFYSTKDIPCLSLYIICTYTLIKYLDNKTFVNALIHALASGLLIDTRVVGFLFPLLTLIFTLTDIGAMNAKSVDRKKELLSLIEYGVFLIVFTILFWPFLWTSPFYNFIFALLATAHFQWNLSVLYGGQYLPASRLPWHYIPVWMAITTPLVYVITFGIGYLKTIMQAGKNFAQFYRDQRGELIILLLFSLPMLAVMLGKPILYDGWRHMFFVYPAFLVFSLIGLRALFGFARGDSGGLIIKTILIILILCDLGKVVLFMTRNHPYQNVYFNRLAGRNMKEIKDRFELDYWGLSYAKALAYIAANDPDPVIKVYMDHFWGEQPLGTEMLDARDSKRLVRVDDIKEAKYFLSDFRWHKEEYPYKNEFYSIKVDGASIAVVYRL